MALSLLLLLCGCATVHRNDEDASQGRDGIPISVLDIVDAARNPSR